MKNFVISRSYDEKLEVFECNCYFSADEPISAKYVHSYTTEGWVKTPCLKIKLFYIPGVFETYDQVSEVLGNFRFGDVDLCFTTLLQAKIAKLMLEKERICKYWSVTDIDLDKPLKELKEEYPEYFI